MVVSLSLAVHSLLRVYSGRWVTVDFDKKLNDMLLPSTLLFLKDKFQVRYFSKSPE